MKPRIESRSRRCLRRELHTRGLLAALLFLLSASAWAQPTPLPVLTYQYPQSYQQYVVTNSQNQQRQALQYSVPSGSPVWTSEDSVVWRNVSAHENNNIPNYPISGVVPPNAPIINQRVGYHFYLDETQIPATDSGSPPRNEFSSVLDHPVNIGNQCDPTPYTWEKDGVVTESTAEKIFIWSMWLTQDPARDQGPPPNPRRWADLNQWHPGGPAYGPYAYCNWWTAGCRYAPPDYPFNPDCNTWPVCATNNIPAPPNPAHLLFHTNRISGTCPDWHNPQSCSNINTEPPRLWDVEMPQYYGQWVDLAMYIKPSTDNSIGKVNFWVNGNEVGPVGGWLGSSFYSTNPNPPPPYPPNTPLPPFYYVNQGYYRDRNIRDAAQGGVHVYMTPMLVTTPSALAPRR